MSVTLDLQLACASTDGLPSEAQLVRRFGISRPTISRALRDLKDAGFDGATIAAINTSGQQHGHVYLNAAAKAACA